jgi:hypothetical protein
LPLQLEELEFSHISQIPSLADVTPAELPAAAGAEPQVSKRVRLASPPPGLPSLSTEQQAHVEECYVSVMATYAAGVRRLPVARARAQDLEMLYTETDQLSGGWLSTSRHLLAELLQQEQRVEHVLVTNGEPALLPCCRPPAAAWCCMTVLATCGTHGCAAHP